MLKKCILSVLSHSVDELNIKEAINDFVHYKHSNYKVTTNDMGQGGLIIVSFVTNFDATFIKERLLDRDFPYYFMVQVMDSDDDFDYSFNGLILDDLEVINDSFILKREEDYYSPSYFDEITASLKVEGTPIEWNLTTSDGKMVVYDYLNPKSSDNGVKDNKDYTLDELIDIINEVGYDNLTPRQLECLKNYN